MDIITRLFTHRRLLLVGFLILILSFLVTFPIYGGDYYMLVLVTIFLYIVLSVSWVMFSGPTGYMSLAPAAFFGVGIYIGTILGEKLPLIVAVAAGGLGCFVLALLIGLVTLRLRGIYFAIFTFGLLLFLTELILYLEIHVYGSRGRHVFPASDEAVFYIMLGICVVTLVAAYLIRRSRLGLALQSIGGNEEAAAHMGINTTRVKILTFAISAIFMGAAGAIMAPSLIYIDPFIAFNMRYSFMPILMAVFGGMGQFYGPAIGAAVFAYTERILRLEYPYHYMLTFGIILIVVIVFLPGGLVGLIPRLQKTRLITKLLNKGKEEQHADT